MPGPILSQVTLIFQCHDSSGVIRTPTDASGYFGISFYPNHTIALSKQIKSLGADKIGAPQIANEIELVATISPGFSVEGSESTRLFLARIRPELFEAPKSWPIFIDRLRSMPPGKMRVAYNKVLQYMLSVQDEKLDVLEIDEQVLKIIKKNPKSEFENS